MKTIIAFALVCVSSMAFATELKVPPLRSRAPAVQPTPPDPRNACLAGVLAECEAKNWTKIGKRACIRWKSRSCR